MHDRELALYVRVSTNRQDLRAQGPELKAWVEDNAGERPVKWYRDKHTGRSMNRPALKKLERTIADGNVGTLVVWRNDRMGRARGSCSAFSKTSTRRASRTYRSAMGEC